MLRIMKEGKEKDEVISKNHQEMAKKSSEISNLMEEISSLMIILS